MLQQQAFIINMVLMVLDAICVILAGYGAMYLRLYCVEALWTIGTEVFYGSVIFVMAVGNYAMGVFKLYGDHSYRSFWSLVWSVIKSMAFTFAFLGAGFFLMDSVETSRMFLLYFAGLSCGLIVLERGLFLFCLNQLKKDGYSIHRLLVVGDMSRGRMVTDLMKDQLSWGHEIVGHVSITGEKACHDDFCGKIEQLPKILRDQMIDEVIFAMPGDKSIDLGKYLGLCHRMGITARILPALWRQGEQTVQMETCQGVPFLTLRGSSFNATGLLYKRILDIAGGAVGTLLFLLMYPVVGLMIKLDSPGPIIFKQKRVGQNGRVFAILKFRTMCVDAEEKKKELVENNQMNGAMFKMENDPRITRVGCFLRKTSLDEFPQFLNVLRGHMSLVGTRPPTLDEVAQYQLQHLKRISAKPGLTGMWQVSGRNKIEDFEEVVRLDCGYLDQWRFSTDVKILVKTVFAVLRRKGAV